MCLSRVSNIFNKSLKIKNNSTSAIMVNLANQKRMFSKHDPLKERLEKLIPSKVEEIVTFRKENKDFIVDSVKLDQLYSGMRGIKAMTYETSLLDSEEGIRFRGFSIPELQKKLPSAPGSNQPLPEGVFWLLLTGEIPDSNQVEWITYEWNRRSIIPTQVSKFIDSLPESVHPMAQLSAAITILSAHSKFSKMYNEGKHNRNEYWKFVYEDAMDLIAKIPIIAARIYRNVYYDGTIRPLDKTKDWGYNYANMMGSNDDSFVDYIRLYLTLHSDHEGGNVSAHTNKLVASALSDPFLSYASGINGLAGPLHGRANQEVVNWLENLIDEIGVSPSKEELREYCVQWLKKGVIPGYGHAVLRKTDPRFSAQLDFADESIKSEPAIELIKNLNEIVPDILLSTGKVKNPWPNVDAISGTLLGYFGVIEKEYYTVPFAVSRSIGCMASTVWDRILNMPIERPKSLTTESLKKIISKR